MTKIIFFGTQDFGAAILSALIASNQYEIVAVITQPDRPIGRTQNLSKSPVKLLAEKYNLNVLQPESLKNFQFPISNFQLSIVCQYGLIIPKFILDIPKHGTLNVHTSLLPKYRGASPIQTAIVNGEKETGVTIMLMDEKMDHGPILAQEKVAVQPDDTALTLSDRMMPIASNLLLKTIPTWLAGAITPEPQNDAQATLCKILTRDNGKIDFNKTAEEIYNLYRGLTPWPGVWTTWNGKRLKLLNITPSPHGRGTQGEGRVNVADNRIFIVTADGSLEVSELQLEGKKPMTAEEFINGYQNFNGSLLS